VGVEFLIDEQLAESAPTWSGYSRALQFGSSEAGRSALVWASLESEYRFTALCRRLLTLAHVRANVPALLSRLFATLADRPRLALKPADSPLVAAWLSEAAQQVALGLPELLGELEAVLKSDSAR
jgi:hypothetical protein